MQLSKSIKEYNVSVSDTLNYNIVECKRRGILPEYVRVCEKILKEMEE